MKRGLFTAIFTLSFAALVSAQAPNAVSTAFSQAHPGVNATYTQQGNEWRAGFTQNGKQLAYIYTPEGNYVAKETIIAKNEIPTPALQDMEARFSGFTFEQAAEHVLPDGTVHYKYQYMTGNSHVEVFYAANGQMIRRAVFF